MEAAQEFHELHLPLGTVASVHHVLQAQGVGLPLVVTAVAGKERAAGDLPQVRGELTVAGAVPDVIGGSELGNDDGASSSNASVTSEMVLSKPQSDMSSTA